MRPWPLTAGKSWKRQLHSIKGDARTLGIRSLASLMHQLEDDLKNSETWTRLRSELQEYQNLTKNFKDPAQDSKSLASLVSPLLPELRDRLARADLAIERIQVTESVRNWTSELSLALKPILIHSLQNAVDHGYLCPISRGWMPRPFACEISVEECGRTILLSVADQGAGVDFPKLAARARQLGWPEGNTDKLLELLFDDGFSTAENISESSGRGVGLAAIRSLCRERGGDAVIVALQNNQGIVLRATLSLDALASHHSYPAA